MAEYRLRVRAGDLVDWADERTGNVYRAKVAADLIDRTRPWGDRDLHYGGLGLVYVRLTRSYDYWKNHKLLIVNVADLTFRRGAS